MNPEIPFNDLPMLPPKRCIETSAARQTAALYLQKLEAIGILSSIKRGRERYYLNKRLLAELSK